VAKINNNWALKRTDTEFKSFADADVYESSWLGQKKPIFVWLQGINLPQHAIHSPSRKYHQELLSR